MKTSVYIDGFNLYYGAVKGTPHKWLDLGRLCRLLLPTNSIHRIRYFTANISARPGSPRSAINQQVYLRALRTVPGLSIHLGHFLVHSVRMPLAAPVPGGPQFATVLKTEEKGSDVNLASHLVHDGHMNEYDCAVVVTNDSDLLEPIRIVRERLGKTVGVLNPHQHPSKQLARHSTFLKQIRAGALGASQFPPAMRDATGLFHKPQDW